MNLTAQSNKVKKMWFLIESGVSVSIEHRKRFTLIANDKEGPVNDKESPVNERIKVWKGTMVVGEEWSGEQTVLGSQLKLMTTSIAIKF